LAGVEERGVGDGGLFGAIKNIEKENVEYGVQ
jgi:hypothetical protein